MRAPRDIFAALECVTSIFFSDVRHKNRAAFILCDELVEMTCKAKAKASNHQLGRVGFHSLLCDAAVSLDPANSALGHSVHSSHRTRNDMQHNNAAATVDDPHCADVILDAVNVIDHCYAGASAEFPDGMKILLRVISLHATNGNKSKLAAFEGAMVDNRWGTAKPKIRTVELPVPVGHRRYWGLVIHSEYATIEALLNRIGAP
jgi:hypothetical protein